MYLEKLEIQGFKSFANKNRLVFPGMLNESKHGITAIVGPNGSGKSNVADAVRWALGEQSMKTLRGKRSADVIFSGSDRKGRLGMAEVSLYLNNEDKRAEVDYSELIITRRLYRNGDSEYMINNSRARLADIQMLLAKAKFGQKTYSVIGQGMVEGFLNTSLAERKEFFDEATGVKQFQIKRDESLLKLRSSYENLIQAQMLLGEIEPRLKSLTRQVNKLKKRGELENELKEQQLIYYQSAWHEINDQFSRYNNEFLELEKVKFSQEKKLASLNKELEQLEGASVKENKLLVWQTELVEAQERKEDINKRLAHLEARMEIKLEGNGQFDLSFLIKKKDEVGAEMKKNSEEIELLEKNLTYDKAKGEELSREKNSFELKLNAINEKMSRVGKVGNDDNEDFKTISDNLGGILERLKIADNEDDIGIIKKNLGKIKTEMQSVLERARQFMENLRHKLLGNSWPQLQKEMQIITQAKEELILKINDNNLRITARGERVKLLKEKLAALEEEKQAISDKLRGFSAHHDIGKANEEKKDLVERLAGVKQKIKEIQNNITAYSSREEKEKSQLFSLQRSLQALQNEINITGNQLNEYKINSTRYETKLEDLEIEMREEAVPIAKVREKRLEEEIDINASKGKINQFKKQLEQIGGIDPQIEAEYKETNERYGFLSGQAHDLKEAVASLETVIKELDEHIKERFDKEFKIIAQKFEEYFKILFNGGQAKIVKIMQEAGNKEEAADNTNHDNNESKKESADIADIKRIKFLQKHNATGLAGIEIQATPPGKKIRSISMLSGGERALTAIGLICAIISANPSPFVVLDEVDAALDESNSARLAKILDELSQKTQFIVITHNRATMRRASIIYGITMGNDSVSKLLSIKLEEAKEAVRNE